MKLSREIESLNLCRKKTDEETINALENKNIFYNFLVIYDEIIGKELQFVSLLIFLSFASLSTQSRLTLVATETWLSH